MSSKKTSTQQTNQTQTNSAPSYLQPGMQNIAGRVNDNINNPTPGYQGDFFARPDDSTTQAIMDAYSRAGGMALQQGDNLTNNMARLDSLDFSRLEDATAREAVGFNYGPEVDINSRLAGLGNLDLGRVDDPSTFVHQGGGAELNAAINASIDPVFEQLTEQVLPGIRSSALASGAYGNSRAMGTLPGQAIEDATESAQRIAAELGYQGFQQEENRRLTAYSDYEQNLLQAFGLNTQAATSEEQARLNAQQAATAAFGAGTTRGLGEANINASLATSDADRNMAATRAALEMELTRAGMAPQLADGIMRMYASEGDLLTRSSDADIYNRQIDIDNALARDEYDFNQPWRGLDMGTQLLTQLGAGQGTSTMNGTTTTTEKTGGLGNVLQGVAGLGGLAASAFMGPAGAVASTAANAARAGQTTAASAFNAANYVMPQFRS